MEPKQLWFGRACCYGVALAIFVFHVPAKQNHLVCKLKHRKYTQPQATCSATTTSQRSNRSPSTLLPPSRICNKSTTQGKGKHDTKAGPVAPKGWTKEETTRKSGASAGTKDTVWRSPDGRTICRSLADIQRYMKTVPK